jgi:putative transposase
MTRIAPEKEWWTCREIAEARLPDLPQTPQGVETLLQRQGWRSHPEFARKRAGRGGGWEYNWQLFPSAAQRQLLLHLRAAPKKPEGKSREETWAWYDGLPQTVKDKAQARLVIIQQIEALEPVLGRYLAVDNMAKVSGVGERTIWTWLALIEGVRADDRLAYLAPRNRAPDARKPRAMAFDPEFFDLIKSDFLRLAQPSFSSCYRRALRVAKAKEWQVAPERTMRRYLDRMVSNVTQVMLRKGFDAVKRLHPSQQRDKTAMHALEAVNADFHKFDVFVRWPARPGQPSFIGRPQMVAFQDIYSARILSWRVDQTPNSTAVMLAAGDMIEDWGIPDHVLLDNGREFAGKKISGGTETRFRFTVKEDDILGLFPSLGIQIHWATPYSGQSKPIERAFRDMCDTIAKDPRFDGAWTGNKPEAKPEDYGSRAIDLAEFVRVLAEGIEEHNTRVGRRSEVAYGRSFAEVFDESYATAPIRRATEAQRRLWLMGAEGLRINSRTAEIQFQGNRYWADWMHDYSGQRVVARFDMADLWAGLHVYGHDGSYLGHAPTLEQGGFFDIEDARHIARTRREWIKAERTAGKAHVRYTAAQIGEMLDEVAPVEPPKPEAKVVRLARAKTTKAPVAPIQKTISATVTKLRVPAIQPATEEIPREKFRRALELERAIEAGQPVTREQKRWLAGFQTTSTYRSERMLWDRHGDAMFG